ncbi:Steroidogenic acute regulatory protein-like [Gryllus bimaculatus]|nr:Steroidogenic acute regulatory protein-like [Gryllus bimaculatus]
MAEEAATTDSALVASFRRRGQEALELARKVLHSGPWRFESRTPDGDQVHSCAVPGVGRVLMITAFYNCSAHTLKQILIDGLEDYPKWSNAYVKDSCKRLMMLGDDMDVTRVATSARLGGLVSARDWLSVRHWCDGVDEKGVPETVSCGVAVTHPDFPAGKGGMVRGETLLSAYGIADAPPAPAEAGAGPRCRLRFLCCARLGGWLPHSVVERYFAGGLVDFAGQLRRRLDAQDAP